jgi:hypothetical protein
MLGEGRGLTLGALRKQGRSGDWRKPHKPHRIRQLRTKLSLEAKQKPDPRFCAVGVTCVCLWVNPIGEPDAANPHVRFDERGAETEAMGWNATPARGESRRPQLSPSPKATAPLLDSTAAATRENDKSGRLHMSVNLPPC